MLLLLIIVAIKSGAQDFYLIYKSLKSLVNLQFVKSTDLKLDDPFLGKAQVHALRVLQVEGTFMELGDRVIRIEQRRLLVHFTNNLEKHEKDGDWSSAGEECRKKSRE